MEDDLRHPNLPVPVCHERSVAKSKDALDPRIRPRHPADRRPAYANAVIPADAHAVIPADACLVIPAKAGIQTEFPGSCHRAGF